jgi:hypothetical protein
MARLPHFNHAMALFQRGDEGGQGVLEGSEEDFLRQLAMRTQTNAPVAPGRLARWRKSSSLLTRAGLGPDISYANRSADLRAGFQTCGRCERFDALPIWKSAIQQVWNPALQARSFVSLSKYEISGLGDGVVPDVREA